jgi:hypothetical protein
VGITCVFFLVLLCTTPGNTLSAQAKYQLQYPFSTSPYAGAEFHILLHHELSWVDNRFIPSRIINKEDCWSTSGNILYRLGRMSTYGFYMAYIPVVNQHEYFGHLARAKQLHAISTSYEIYFFPPTGGRSYFGRHTLGQRTDVERITEYMGGVEANSIMAKAIQRNSFQEGRMSFQDAMLYIGAKTDFNTYVLFENNDSFDDVSQYLSVLNNQVSPEKLIQRKDLVLPSIFSVLLDPYMFQSFTKLIGQFLISGNTSFDAPSMLQLGRIGFLPYYSFEPGGTGFRHYLNGYLRTDRQLYHISMHKGAFHENNDFGLQAELYGFSMIHKILNFDFDLRYWHSEPLTFHNNAGELQESKLSGALLGAKLYLQALPESYLEKRLFITTGFSMKSPGYTKGYPLLGGLSFSFGIAYSS